MRKLKQFTFIRREEKAFGWRRFIDYICHNGEKEVKKSRREVITLIREKRINLTIDQLIEIQKLTTHKLMANEPNIHITRKMTNGHTTG